MSDLRATDSQALALFTSDWHLSIKPPIWRSAEPNWLEATKRILDQLKELQKDLGDPPILCAGDIFDKWHGGRSSSELINFAIENMPRIFAIPGQHDLPLHNYKDIKKSAYWTLVEAGKVSDLLPDENGWLLSKDIRVWAYPWGHNINPCPSTFRERLNICIVHQYVWSNKSNCYGGIGPSNSRRVCNMEEALSGYDVAVFGDNHIGFKSKVGNTVVWNCGGFMRRNSDQIDYCPRVGVLWDNGKVTEHCFDVSQELHLEARTSDDNYGGVDMSSFISELEKLGDSSLDYEQAIKSWFDSKNVKKAVQDILLKAMGT